MNEFKIGDRVKLVKSKIPYNLGKIGMIIEYSSEWDEYRILFDDEIYIQREGKDGHFLSTTCYSKGYRLRKI